MANQPLRAIREEEQTGKQASESTDVAKELCGVLADSYLLQLKSQNFHWNVEGRRFYSLHKLLEEHYEDLQEAVDEIAERIRALGFYSPGRFEEFKQMSQISPASEPPFQEHQIIEELRGDHEKVSRLLTDRIELCEKKGDRGTADLLTERQKVHDKAAWMLRAMVEKDS